MNEGDGSTLPYELVELRHKAGLKAIEKLVSTGILPQGQYTTERVFTTEFATNYENVYRFNVQIRDQSGVEYRVWFVAFDPSVDHSIFSLVDTGYKENRIGEFTHTEFKLLPPVEESQVPYPPEVEDLRSKSVNQAVGRMIAKNIFPQNTYSIFNAYDVEYSDIMDMPEYPDHDDMLYRFNVRISDQSGTLFRVWAVIATNYETPEYYELIDYGYKQSRLAEFTETDWREMNEGEGMSLPGEIVDIRSRSVAQAVQRFIAEGTLPNGQYTIAKTYATEFSGYFENPNYPSSDGDVLYRFNVQLSNEAGERFRVAVVVITSFMIQPKYELIDYFYVENRLDEFTSVKFVSLDEGDLEEKSVNEAVGRMVAKDILPEGEYTIVKTYPTEFSPKFENPDYFDDEYVLFNFTAQVNNTAGAGFKVYAVVLSGYDDLQDYELIDYGKINA